MPLDGKTAPGHSSAPTVQSKLIHLVDVLSDAIMLLDEDFRILYANPMALRIAQITEANINRETLWELYPGVLESNLGQAYLRAVATHSEQTVEGYYYDPLKTTFDLHIFPMQDGLGVHFRNVTVTRQAEAARDAYAEQLQQVLAATSDAILSLDRDYRIIYLNARARAMLAASGDPVGTILWESYPYAVYPGSPYVYHYDRAMTARLSSGFQAFYPEPFNFWLDVMARPAPDGIVVFFRDITEEKAKTEALHAQFEEIDRSRRELETIYQGSPIGMALYEPEELRLLRINERQAEIFRLPAAEAIGKTFAELTAGVPASLPLIRRAAAGERVLNGDVDGVPDRCPGEHRYWNVNYSPIFAPDGSVQAIAAATVETTQQKRAETALIQTEKLAAVGRMASSIAHEINNPLESVTNLIYIVRQYSSSPEVSEFLTVADQELRRVSIIANQTLRFHKQSSLPREITCDELFATVLSLYEGRLRNSAVSVEKRKRARRPVACFEGDIRQVLNNLVGNAIDAMPLGGRLLLRSREATDWRPGPGPARRGLVLTIADTGAGMSPQTRAHVFEPFFTTKGMNGTGLGLWISAEIVERHQGRLLLRSSQNQAQHGTVFSLFLPFEALPHNPAQTLDPPRPSAL